VVLDHHKTALETLPPNGTGPPNLQVLLDMRRSGATIAYDYFLQGLQAQSPSQSFFHDEKVLRLETLFKYIQDADLWTWALPDSKSFSSGLSDSGIEYSVAKNPEVFDQV
jgi:oligoribonuclease NrnB/cAMP/cGMP phosphodiesterase (DHH superfamily)